jgi:hypothetical protein
VIKGFRKHARGRFGKVSFPVFVNFKISLGRRLI